jgi:hypothetical protein
MRFAVLLPVLISIHAPSIAAQSAGQPITVGDATVSGMIRTRAYAWNWFGPGSRASRRDTFA